jgi:hypothetical protein
VAADSTDRRSGRVNVAVAIIAFMAFSAIDTTSVWAGMPSASVVADKVVEARLQTISFFIAVFLAAAGIVRLLWNALAKDFSRLPRLTYMKALALVFLWGMLFLFVLTMISGARELMTPGAWEPNGATYKLRQSS